MPRIFADDTNISYAAADSVNELQNVLNSELKSLHNWLNTNRLSPNIAITKFMTIGSRQKIRAIHDEITIKINECEINRVVQLNPSGCILTTTILGQNILDKISKKIASAIGALKRIRPYITTNIQLSKFTKLLFNPILIIVAWSGMALAKHLVVRCKNSRTERQGSL